MSKEQSAKEPKKYKIVKSDSFQVGTSRLGNFVKDRQLRIEFGEGKPIEVDEDTFNKIKKLSWCVIAREKK